MAVKDGKHANALQRGTKIWKGDVRILAIELGHAK